MGIRSLETRKTPVEWACEGLGRLQVESQVATGSWEIEVGSENKVSLESRVSRTKKAKQKVVLACVVHLQLHENAMIVEEAGQAFGMGRE